MEIQRANGSHRRSVRREKIPQSVVAALQRQQSRCDFQLQEWNSGAATLQTKFTLTGETCVYLYGIVASRSLGPQGLEDMLHGIEDASGMFLIEAGNLACVAVFVQSSEYRDRLREDASNQLAWLGPRALRHHEILRSTAAADGCDRAKVATLSAAVLLEKSRFEALEAILEQLESEYACYLLSAEISGPWPPYSFSTDLDRFQNSGSPGMVLRKNA